MALRRFTVFKTSNQELQQVQQNTKETLDALVDNPTNSSNTLRNVPLVVGNNTVAHGLGRNYLSVFPGIPTVATVLTQGTSPDRSKFIVIHVTVATTVDLLVF